MRKTFLYIILLVGISAYSQKIEVNKKDDMTNNNIIKTSMEKLTSNMVPKWIKVGVDKINDKYLLSTTICMGGQFFIVSEGGEIILKLTNDSLVTLKSIERATAHDGIGGKQAEVRYLIPIDKLDLLRKNGVKKVRPYAFDGYVDIEVQEKKYNIIQKEIELIDNLK